MGPMGEGRVVTMSPTEEGRDVTMGPMEEGRDQCVDLGRGPRGPGGLQGGPGEVTVP
jgi:hypothetical protein